MDFGEPNLLEVRQGGTRLPLKLAHQSQHIEQMVALGIC
jgi:hypothetical protein